MKNRFLPLFNVAVALPAAITLVCGGISKADNFWDGGGSNPFNWSDATNWGSNTAPGYGTLTFSGSTGTTNTVDSSVSQNMLLWSGSSAWTLNNSGGAVISLFDNGGVQAKIENQSTGLVTINAPIAFAATTGAAWGEINAVNGDITFGSGGTIAVSGSAVNELRFYGSGRTVTVNSVITAGSKKLVIGPNTTDNNTVILNAANSYSGNTEVNVGTVQVGNNTGLGTSTTYLGNGGSTFSSLNSSLLLNTSGLTVSNQIVTNKADTGAGLGTGTRTIGGNFTSGSSTFSGNIFLNGGAVLAAGNGGTVTFSGIIANGTDTGNVSRDLAINSPGGTVVLSGVNTYTGKTSISGGTVSIAADSGLGTAPGAAVADQLTLNGGTLRISAVGQTLSANRGITLGSSGGTFDTSAQATSATTTLSGIIAGTGSLTLKSNGDLTASGGGAGGLGIKLNATNTFTGNVTITSGLVSYASNASFGNAANNITLNGGGLLDPATSTALSRNIQVLAGGGTFRAYGASTVTWAGAITGSGTINRTDGGTLTHSGDLSGYTGTYNVQAGTTQLTGTASSIGGNWTVATGTTLTINSSAAQSIAGSISGVGTLNLNSAGTLTLNNSISMAGGVLFVNGTASAGSTSSINMGTGTFRVNGTGIMTLGSGSTLNADQIAFTGTTSNQLNIQSGATVTTKYINLGDAGSNSGRIVQTGGNVTIASGSSGMRIGHWNNAGNASSLYNLSGGTLDASAITSNIGWDGQGDMIVGGGAGSALFKAGGIQLDANGNGGGSGAGDMTLTVSGNGTVEVGTAGIGAAAAGDRVILNGGSMKAVGSATWASVINANTSTSSTLNTNGFTVTLSNNITGTGTINLSSATGGAAFSTTGTQTVTANLDGTTAISKLGTGTTTLSGGGTYSGTMTVSAGRLNLAGSTAGSISVASAQSFGGEGTTTGSLTFAGTNSLFIDPTTAGKLTVGNLTLTGTNTLKFDATPTGGGGAFNVLTYTGSLSGAFGTNLVVDNAAKYRSTTFTDTAGVVTLDLGTKSLTWNGTSGGQWDVRTSARWGASEVDQFAWGDAVTFDDTGVATTLTISGELQPSSITATGTKNYTLNGGAGNFISGTTGISKSGSSTVIVNAPNTFTGVSSVTGGTLQIGDGTNNTATLGTSAASVGSGATLAFYRNGTGISIANNLSGAGTVAFLGTGVSNQSDYVLSGTNTGLSGTLDIRSGARVQVDSTNDAGTAGIVVNSGGQLFLSTSISNPVTVNGTGWTEPSGLLGAVRFSGGTLGGTVTLSGDTRFTSFATADTGTISGAVTGGFGIDKTGSGILILSGTNTYTGNTTASGGLLRLNSASALPGGIAATGGTANVSLNGGLLGLGNGDLTRGLGTGATQIQLAGTSGFAAFTANRTINFGGANAAVTWGSGGFAPSTLVLGHTTADFTAIISNPIDLGAVSRTVQADDGTAAIDGQLSGILSGTGSLIKTGAGVLALSNTNTFSGGTTVNAGILDLTGGGGGNGTIRGTATINTGATLRLSTGDATGYNGGSTVLNTINLVGGTLSVNTTSNQTLGSAVINMTGGTITGVATSNLDFFVASSAINTLASSNTSTVSGVKLTIRQTAGLTVTVADGAATTDLQVDSVIASNSGFTTAPLIKAGTGVMTLTAANTYTGTTSVTGGVLKLNNATAVTGGIGATGGLSNISLNGGVLGLGNGDLSRGLGTAVAQIQLAGTSGFAAYTANRTINFGGANAAVTWGSGNFAPTTLVLGHATSDFTAIISNPIDLASAARTVQADDGTAAVDGQLSGVLSGTTGSLIKTGSGTLSLSGANTFGGSTTVSAGTLALDYSTQANSKLADAAALIFSGSSTLSLNGGSLTEVVGSTTLNAGVNASITRPSGTSVIQLGTITRNAGATLNLGASGIATTNNTNTNGIIGSWATVGSDWAANSTNGANGSIIAYTGYSDVPFAGSVADATANNVRLTGGTSGNVTLAAATTNSNSLLQNQTTATTIDASAKILRLGIDGAIFAGSGKGALTIGTAVASGTLTAGGNVTNGTGNIAITNNSSNTITINSVIANNGTGAVSLTKTGTGLVTLAGTTGANYSGGTTINGGELRVSTPTTAGTYTILGTGAVTANAGTTLRFFTGSTTSALTYANAINLNTATLINEDGNHTLSGAVALTGANTINGIWGGKNLALTGVVSGAGSITKTGAADLTLSGTNTFSGGLTINSGGGKVNLNSAAALGTGALTINGSGIDNTSAGALTLTTNNTQTWAGDFTFTGTQSLNLGTGAVSLSASRSVVVSANTLTVGGGISGAGFGLTKSGAGTLALTGNNTYTGATTVTAGRLNATGTNASSITLTGATLGGIGSTTGGLTTNAGSIIALNPTAPASAFTASGAVNFAAATTVAFDSVPTALGSTAYTVVNYGSLSSGITNLTGPAGYRSVVSNDTTNKKVLLTVTTGTRTWNQTTAATWNNLTGSTFAEGDFMFASGDSVVFDNTATNGAVTLSGTLLPSAVTVNNTTTDYTFSGSGVIGGNSTLTKSGTGALTISNANTYTGATTISGGTVIVQNANALGSTAAGTIVTAGGQLQLQGGITTAAEALSLSGTGPSSDGALNNASGNNTYAGPITLAGNASVSVASGTTLTTSGTLTLSNTLTKVGAGTLKFTNYGGSAAAAASDIVINAGTVEFATGFFNSSPFGFRALTITANTGGILRVSAAHGLGGDNIDSGTSFGQVRVIGGTFQVDGSQYISGGTVSTEGRLVLQGGSVTGTSDLRTVPGTVISSLASSTTSTISNTGGISTGFASVAFDVADGSAAVDLQVSSVISSTNGVTKSGAGLLQLTGNNTYTGATAVNAGALRVDHANGLGTTAAGTTVSSGAALQLANGIAVGSEALGLSGSGVSSDGALRNISGINSFAGAITLNAASRINSDSGSLTLSGGIGGAAQNLTVGGAGDTTISGVIGTTSGTLTKDGAGMLTLSNTNTFTGSTSILGGKISVSSDANLGTAPGSATTNQLGLNDGTLYVTTGFTLDSNRGIAVGPASGTGAGTIEVASTQTLGYGGIIANNGSGTGGLIKDGTGRLILTGNSTYTGTTTVSAGTLLVNGTNSGTGVFNVSSGAILGGTGSIAGAVNVTGTLSPGASIETLATGNLSLAAGSTFAYELDSVGLNGDLLDSSGLLDIASGAILSLTELSSGVLANDSKLTLISYFGGWSSSELFTYQGNVLNDGDTFTLGSNEWRFDYNDTTGGSNFTSDQAGATSFVTMTVVPEPTTALLGGLSLLALLRRRRS